MEQFESIEQLCDEAVKEVIAGHPDSVAIMVASSASVKRMEYEVNSNPSWLIAVTRFIKKFIKTKHEIPFPSKILYIFCGELGEGVDLGPYLLFLANKHSVVTYTATRASVSIASVVYPVRDAKLNSYMVFKEHFYTTDREQETVVSSSAVFQA